MFYIITDISGQIDAQFFRTREEAEEWQQENYYVCTGDVRPVPELTE